MKTCTKCLLPETYPGLTFDENNLCSSCKNFQPFRPQNHDILLKTLDKAKRKKARFDALVPLSGGKDSSYILYLARKVYNLRVLSFTFDNGFLAPTARKNILELAESLGADHIMYKPSWDLLMRLYRSTLLLAGDMCGVCGVGIVGSSYEVASRYRIPLILIGSTPMEENSGSPENIYNSGRLQAILRDAGLVAPDEFKLLLALLRPNTLTNYFQSKLGFKPQNIYPMYFREQESEEKIRQLLIKETRWRDASESINSKHFDCTAEPFTNFLREHRHGYSRRLFQYSNLIRLGELSREEAQKLLEQENPTKEPANTEMILERLGISHDELDRILKIKTCVYDQYSVGETWPLRIAKSLYRKFRKLLRK